MRIIANALGASDAAGGLYDLAARIGAPVSLRELGMPFEGMERAAKLATANPYPNPRQLEYNGVFALIENAWHGRRP
jgi:alcohol dehydrogenase class IV